MNGGFVVGADVGGSRVKYVLLDAGGRLLEQAEIDTDPHDPGRTLALLAEAVRADADAVAGAEVSAGLGLACAGIVDAHAGRLGRAPNLPGWEGADLALHVTAAFGSLPATFANDVNAALYGEWQLGAGRGCRDLVMLALGTGVGGGVLVGGHLVTGRNFGAGEIGHMVLDPDGPDCTCGNRGCLEAYAGGWALVRRARAWVTVGRAGAPLQKRVLERGDALTPLDIAGAAQEGDACAAEILQVAGRRLGQAVSSLVNILDPDRVIIGGGVAQAGDYILEPIRSLLGRSVLCEASRTTPVVAAELGPFAAALGAAAMVRAGEGAR